MGLFATRDRTSRCLEYRRIVAWLLPEQIVAEGFVRSRVVMMNEGHNGFSRCLRSRHVGLSVLPAAHKSGCRYLAMEALMNSGVGPSFVRTPPSPYGLFAQPDMFA